jgi:hypothetical protein
MMLSDLSRNGKTDVHKLDAVLLRTGLGFTAGSEKSGILSNGVWLNMIDYLLDLKINKDS